ncbi:hypothetical protein CBS147355_8799 [Penicillium roqueforti]|nr:hypothetical protein CBS147337_5764 [Penicillium roqueforti]KAI2671205.1 hypothetical protein CBS147355_8799 [Penicillium roqueforti]KAI2709974.1 hypothetical protein CBS147318_8833 [Penicillium roqueforti]KAI3119735.1 hypothetical protein CBS147330_8559 [Penicillium roqueforti]KAI3132285.1 hypothetical protein CBS147326_5176 [Penicillium roqueforti]
MHTQHPAQTRALAMPEIVISILHQMDMRTLIAAQRVCHTWADPIRTSRSLQKALFFIPASENSGTDTRVYNPLLAQAFKSAFPSKDLQNSSNVGARIEDIKLAEFDLAKSPAKMEIYLRPEASWRRMLTQQPPVFTVGRFRKGIGQMGLSWYQQKAARQDEGLRMGTLFELLVQLKCYEWHSGFIAICLGGAEPLNTPLNIEGPAQRLFTNEINNDWRVMTANFDLVLMTSSMSTCMDPDSDGSDYTKSIGEAVWEKICETYCKLGLTVTELKMEDYNEGSALWYAWVY